MTIVHRVLPPKAYESFDEYLGRGGGKGIEAARALSSDQIIDIVTASGLRGRGGAGFPTGVKWRTVRDFHAESLGTTVVVNAAEGEPGTFKDRTIIRMNPYEVIDGAIIGAKAVGGTAIIVATKQAFRREIDRLHAAIAEMTDAKWLDGLTVTVFEGPDEYLYGEETALLETIDGRYPFPRIAPPWRRGVDEVVDTAADVRSGSGLSAHVQLGSSDEHEAPPALVDNVETMANIPKIIARGSDWFRTEGSAKSPGTVVCTITGATKHAGVAEVMLGTTLREAIDLIGGGPRDGRSIVGVMGGVSSRMITADELDTPLTYEDMAGIGSGLGSAGFVVHDDSEDLVAVAAGISRFLAVESCGQCTPCKQDGLSIADALASLVRNEAKDDTVFAAIDHHLDRVATGARCFLATQQQVVVQSFLDAAPAVFRGHLDKTITSTRPIGVAELIEIEGGRATINEASLAKQPDWTFDATWSGQTPAARLSDHRSHKEI